MTISLQKTAAKVSVPFGTASSRKLREGTADIMVMRDEADIEGIMQIPREPVMGIEPMTPVLPRLCATSAPHGQ